MGGICPNGSGTRVSPVETHHPSLEVVRYHNAVELETYDVVDMASQTDLPVPWAYPITTNHNRNLQDTSAIPLHSIASDPAFTAATRGSFSEDETLSDSALQTARHLPHRNSLQLKNQQLEEEFRTFRGQTTEIKLKIGVLYNGADFSSKLMTIERHTEPLLQSFESVELFNWKMLDMEDNQKFVDLALTCNCFIIFVRGEILPESNMKNLERYLLKGDDESRLSSSSFYAKPVTIACEESDAEMVNKLRNFLASVGFVVMPSILTATSNINDSKAINELKNFAMAVKLIQLASLL